MSVPEIAIKTRDLGKCYRGSEIYALKNLNLEISTGEVYGFLGPNGAGKSTAIRLLMNFLQPTDGESFIFGEVVGSSASIYAEVGYLSGDFIAYPKLTGREFLDYMSVYCPTKNNKNVISLSKVLDIDLSKKIGSLSKGNRQKIGIIQAFMNNPKILILDEPTSGLDPLKQEIFYDLIADAKRSGCCVFMSSHNLAEVQRTCDRVGIIREGMLVHESSIAELQLEASQTLEIVFIGKVPIGDLKKVEGIRHVSVKGTTATLHVHGELTPLLTVISKYRVAKLSSQELDLESEFMRFYQKGSK